MIHPSYVEMIDKINADQDREDAPLVTSRYSIVLATARRARQIVSGVEAFVNCYDRNGKARKPLSVAVDEFYEDKVHILPNRDEGKEESGSEDHLSVTEGIEVQEAGEPDAEVGSAEETPEEAPRTEED